MGLGAFLRSALVALVLLPCSAFTPTARVAHRRRSTSAVHVVARQLDTGLLVADAGALAVYSLTISSFKSFALAGSDLTSPDFNFAADLSSFDLLAIAEYIGVEQYGAACLAVGWVVGGSSFGACSSAWPKLGSKEQLLRLLRGWSVAAPLACFLKYGAFAQVTLPSLGQSAAALALEAELSGLTAPNLEADTLGMLGILLLWRQLLLRNPFLMP